jgi:SRSO17 transposase
MRSRAKVQRARGGSAPHPDPLPASGAREGDDCPLCGRALGRVRVTGHHLIPRRYKGKETRLLHAVCHRKIHATFTDQELRDHYYSFERLLADEGIPIFVEWLRNKPPEFYVPTQKSRRRQDAR